MHFRMLFRTVLFPAVFGASLVAGVVAQPRPLTAAINEAPRLSAPADNATLTTFGPTLSWENPAGVTQYHIQVTPANNDGPGVNIMAGQAGTSFTVPAPPQWYGLLPGMGYTWRVRVSDAPSMLDEGDGSWGPWSPARTFRTPTASSSTVTLASPADGAPVTGVTPTLNWTEANTNIFYYEVQLSRDRSFGPNAFLYWNLLHGGVTTPPNSYVIPAEFPLEHSTTYYWRVRPRVQGDGTPVEWSLAGSFRTPAPGPTPPPATTLSLEVTSPADNATVNTATITVTGRTSAGAVVTVNEALATVQADGSFSATITFPEDGLNIIDVIASNAAGDTRTVTLTVNYIP